MVRRYLQLVVFFFIAGLNASLLRSENGGYRLHMRSKYTFECSLTCLQAFSKELILLGRRDPAVVFSSHNL